MPQTPRLLTKVEFASSRYGQMADTVEGDLNDLILQAENHLENMVNGPLSRVSFVETSVNHKGTIFLQQGPVLTVTQVRSRVLPSDDWSVLDLTAFRLDQRGGYLTAIDPTLICGYEIEVTYDAGYDPIPPAIKGAMILQTAIFAYQDFEIYGGGDAKKPGILYLQDQVDAYIARYRRGNWLS